MTPSQDQDPLGRKWFGLQAIRGLAALVVVMSHIAYWVDPTDSHVSLLDTFGVRCGVIAVFAFYTLSGIVITLNHAKEVGRPPQERGGNFAAFWAKRIFRIYPLFWICSLVNLAFFKAGLTTADHSFANIHSWKDVLASLPLVSVAHHRTLLLPSWSLYQEIFFYLVFGVFLLSFRAGLALVCLALLGTVAQHFGQVGPYYPFEFVNFYFLTGVALMLFRERLPVPRWPGAWVGLALVLFLVLATWEQHKLYSSFFIAVTIVGEALLFIPCLAGPEMKVGGWLHGALNELANISYALYVCHIPTQTLVYRWIGPPLHPMAQAAYVIFPLLVAFALNRTVERPLILVGRKLAARFQHPASA